MDVPTNLFQVWVCGEKDLLEHLICQSGVGNHVVNGFREPHFFPERTNRQMVYALAICVLHTCTLYSGTAIVQCITPIVFKMGVKVPIAPMLLLPMMYVCIILLLFYAYNIILSR